MLSEDRFGMRPLWNALLDIYKEFASVCDAHGLRYFVMEGNAIGAARHKGFVPWDDDFDVAMPRPDYERFVMIAKESLPPHLKFIDWHNTPEFTLSFGKIQETRREIVEGVEKEAGFMLSNGLYIDILVIDGCPSGRIPMMIYASKVFVYGAMLRFKVEQFRRETGKGRCFWLFGCLMSILVPWRLTAASVRRVIDALLRSVPFDGAENTWRVGGTMRLTMTFPKSIWEGVDWLEFDTLKVPLPIGWREYLQIQYGDYMRLPPLECQRPSHSYSWRCPWWLGPTRADNG
mgnify:CR=1 FL=1